MTDYNVTENRADWARVKASLMPPEDRRLLMAELISRDEHHAVTVIGQLAAAQHGLRKAARGRVNYPA